MNHEGMNSPILVWNFGLQVEKKGYKDRKKA
jgi:hypothetical protein